jgi:hypothetical protein
MPQKAFEYPYTVGVRLSSAQIAKLNKLAALTCRPRGAVMRHLLEQAKLSGSPDIILAEVEDGAGAEPVAVEGPNDAA